MIAHLKGIVAQIDKNFLVLEVGGVGYKINVPPATLALLPRVGEPAFLFTVQVVREDDISLYGFLTREEKNLFSLLLKVSGIGPKAGLSIISAFPLEQLVSAIASANVDLLSTISGIGKKTAQKLVIELKEKVAKAYAVTPAEMALGLGAEGGDSSIVTDAISALISLGYTPREARQVILKVDLETTTSVEAIIKQALKNLV